jgi:hypothetical protein
MSGESYLLKNTLIKPSIKAKKKQQNKELWRNRKTEHRNIMKLGMKEKQKDRTQKNNEIIYDRETGRQNTEKQ